jgi:zinc protease
MSRALVLRPLKLPRHDVVSLPNGLTVHCIHRGQLPLVAVRLVIRAGSAFDPAGRLGLADFAARLLRRGAAGRSADDISDAVEFVGANIGGVANEENVIISLSSPARHLDAMLEVFASTVLSPDFPHDEVELSRRRTLAHLQNDLDDPGALADRALGRALWGAHPYGHDTVAGRRDVEAFSRDDLVQFTHQRLGPQIANLYLVGDVDVDSVMSSIERTLGPWRGGPEFGPTAPPWSGLSKPGEVIVVDKPEQTQVQMRIGAKGVRRGHEDHFPLMVMNTVLGGGFTSRLMTEIRVKRGLSYGAGCGFDMMTGAGTFAASSFTKTENVNALIDVCLGEINKMKSKGPSPKEVATAQRFRSGLYPSRLETNEAVAGAFADVVHYGLSDDWIANYRERIVEVRAKEAALAAKRHLFDGGRSIVLVGNAEALKPKISRYGAVTVMSPKELE